MSRLTYDVDLKLFHVCHQLVHSTGQLRCRLLLHALVAYRQAYGKDPTYITDMINTMHPHKLNPCMCELLAMHAFQEMNMYNMTVCVLDDNWSPSGFGATP